MPKLRVIVGLAAAATATMTAVDHAKAEHLRSMDDGRLLAENTETAFLDSIASTEEDSLGGDVWGEDDTPDASSDLDNLDDILTTNAQAPEPTTPPLPIDTSTSSNSSTSDASASDTPAATEPAGSGSAVTATGNDATDAPAATDAAATDAPATVDATTTPDATTEAPATPSSDASASETPAATEPAGSGSAVTATGNDATDAPAATDAAATDAPTTVAPIQLSEVAPWKQCGGLTFDYTQYFADGTSPNWSTKLNCAEGYTCEVVNPWYYQCRAVKAVKTVGLWGQCGGVDYHGLTKCAAGSECNYVNDWYSQCIPKKSA